MNDKETKLREFKLRRLIRKAIKMAQLEKLILSLPEKENTIVGNRGVKLSGGEKQRISIARAIYNNPEILILDEATSALDIENENKILAEMSENLSEKTSIIISHRNNTVKGCDIIYVIENGMIIDKSASKTGKMLNQSSSALSLSSDET